MRAVGVSILALTACVGGGRVNIAPLPPEPTPEQRVALWEMYRPHGNVDEIVTVCSNQGGCDRSEQRVIIFGDHRIVRESEDLAPLVAPDSETMMHSRRAQRFASHANMWSVAGLVAGATGLVMLLGGNDNVRLYGIGILLVGGGIAGYESRADARDARNATSESFAAYPNDLAARLRVCSNGLAVVPCEAPPPAPPPPQPPATNVPARTATR